MKFRPVFIAGSTLLPVAAAVAQEKMQLAEAFVPGLGDEIVVTASRSAQTVKETLASTSVINREQIERSQARNVYQILKTTPGVYVRRNGGRGNQTTVSLRGMPTGGTLILMDGIRLESGTSGTTNLQQINVDQMIVLKLCAAPNPAFMVPPRWAVSFKYSVVKGKKTALRFLWAPVATIPATP